MEKVKPIKPKVGQKYYYISIRYCCHTEFITVKEAVCKVEEETSEMFGNCFKSYKDARRQCDRVRAIFGLSPLDSKEPIETF